MGCFSDILKGSIIVNLLITESVQIVRMLNNKGEFHSLCEWENYKGDTPLNPRSKGILPLWTPQKERRGN